MKTFMQELSERGEGFIDDMENRLQQVRDLAELLYNDSVHDAEYELAEEAAQTLAAVLRVENFVLEHTPQFGG